MELARHVSDNPYFFDEWLSCILIKSNELFSAPQDDLDQNGVFRINNDKNFDPYLMIKEPFILREFYFDPNSDYQTADLKQLQQSLLSSVDYKENPFLSSPERMINIGFVEVPY